MCKSATLCWFIDRTYNQSIVELNPTQVGANLHGIAENAIRVINKKIRQTSTQDNAYI